MKNQAAGESAFDNRLCPTGRRPSRREGHDRDLMLLSLERAIPTAPYPAPVCAVGSRDMPSARTLCLESPPTDPSVGVSLRDRVSKSQAWDRGKWLQTWWFFREDSDAFRQSPRHFPLLARQRFLGLSPNSSSGSVRTCCAGSRYDASGTPLRQFWRD